MDNEEIFYATEELHNFNKNDGTGTSGDNKKDLEQLAERATETQTGSGTRARTRAKTKFLLGQ